MIAIKNIQSTLQLLINFLDRWNDTTVAIPELTQASLILKSLPQKTSEAGISLLKTLEGFRSAPYFCSAYHRTIGYGHVLKKDDLVTTLTEQQAHQLLLNDLVLYEKVIRKHKLDLNQNQFDALVCLVFNIGQTQFEKSKTLKYLKDKNYDQALIEWVGFNKHKDVKTDKLTISQGLINRRLSEIKLFKKTQVVEE